MSARLDWYFRQRVTEAELDKGFEYLERADLDFAIDTDQLGIVSGLAVAQQGTPNLTIALGAGSAYDAQGRRIRIAGGMTVDCSVDASNLSTSVATPGNEKWVSIFASFVRALSDPRTDGNGLPIYFERGESFLLHVVQGPEAALGTAARPALDSGRVLLADVKLVSGQTAITNADISTTRRQDQYAITGSPRTLRATTTKSAMENLLGYFNAHVTGAADRHPATAVDYAGGPAWNDGSTNPATSVEAQLDKIVGDLTGANGAGKIGSSALGAWRDTQEVAEGNVFDNMVGIVAHLAGDDGAAKIGYAGGPAWSDGTSNAATSIEAQLDATILAVNRASRKGYIAYHHDVPQGGLVAIGLTPYVLQTIDVEEVLEGDIVEVHANIHYTQAGSGTVTVGTLVLFGGAAQTIASRTSIVGAPSFAEVAVNEAHTVTAGEVTAGAGTLSIDLQAYALGADIQARVHSYIVRHFRPSL